MRLILSVTVLAMGPCWRSTQFGQHAIFASAADPIRVSEDHPLLNDPDLLGSMEIFMGMSPEEREETIRALMEKVGDDPEKRAEMQLLLSKLPAMDGELLKNSPAGIQSDLKQMVHDDEFSKAKKDARQMLGGTKWEFFLENQAEILESVIASGQISPEQAAQFRTDKEAWIRQLRVIWEDVAKKEL
eukprot:CAMPEP_0113554378 /NCGR_PEP_ID=MMETSP0015_2-20120614/16117_1 /TAXON_ID=2838 /ORGANISM="Odontella" /LENGTH=186 /DNA_ID=CAMNT_0000455515 /DNA_START=225 /DNA_END=785 /DNA_ORIENTATION=- /assembly_acc=CAM_ASM_000160